MEVALLIAVYVVVYLVFTLPLYIVARKLRAKSQWFAFVPILNLVLLVALCTNGDANKAPAGAGCLLLFLFFVPLVNLFAFAWAWGRVSRNTGQSPWLGYLCVIPLLNLILIWVIALRATGPAA